MDHQELAARFKKVEQALYDQRKQAKLAKRAKQARKRELDETIERLSKTPNPIYYK